MFLKNKNIIFKIRRSKVTDHAALTLSGYSESNYTEQVFRVLKVFNELSESLIA